MQLLDSYIFIFLFFLDSYIFKAQGWELEKEIMGIVLWNELSNFMKVH